jgi:CheY-like chemotaxis protein
MKSCRCAQCNVSSARYAWGFALLARDGWSLSELAERETENADTWGSGWICPACCANNRAKQPGLAKPTAPAPSSRRSRPRGTLRVLLVDDEDMVRRCTARALSDFDIVAVASGAEALAVLAGDRDFDAVLSDVMMPSMSGPQLFVRCCHSYPQLAHRFVFASGNPESARTELLKAIAETNIDLAPILLAKPSPREALLLALHAAAAHGEPRSGTYSVADAVVTEVRNYRG